LGQSENSEHSPGSYRSLKVFLRGETSDSCWRGAGGNGIFQPSQRCEAKSRGATGGRPEIPKRKKARVPMVQKQKRSPSNNKERGAKCGGPGLVDGISKKPKWPRIRPKGKRETGPRKSH